MSHPMEIGPTSKLAPVRHRLPAERSGAPTGNPFERAIALGIGGRPRSPQPVAGTDVVAEIRYASPRDAVALTHFYEALDGEARYRRFLQATPRVTSTMAEHVLTPPNAVLVAVSGDEEIVAEVVFAPPRGRPAEIAYAVASAYRRRGLARAMVTQVLADATRDGVEVVEALIGFDNRPSIALMRSLGAEFRPEDGVLVGRLVLNDPDVPDRRPAP